MTARRRHPAARYLVILLGLVLVGFGYALVTGIGEASAAPGSALQGQIAQGRAIFLQECSSCHGIYAQGVPGLAPSLIGVGSAAVDFQVSTGRMPAREPAAENPRKPVQLT